MRLTRVPALPAVKTTRAGSCLLFAADRPTHPDKRAQDFHHPVHRPQGGFPEADVHGRGSCEESRSKIGIYFLKGDLLYGYCLVSACIRYLDYPPGLCASKIRHFHMNETQLPVGQ